jgi:hypothetical protein
MADEVVDTNEAPAESVEPTEPTETEVEEPQPTFITAEQMQEALQKQDSSFRSWLGRRDKETFEHIGNVINERLSAQRETPDEVSTRLLENPRDVIRSEFEAYENERTQKQTTHLNKAMETVGELMESDPLYADKDLGNEVVNEIKQMVTSNRIDYKLSPTAAGKLALADAVTAVFRKRQGAKKNPLSANTPGNTTPGLSPPAKPKGSVKVPKLDDVTQRMAEKWGYAPEDLARIYGE